MSNSLKSAVATHNITRHEQCTFQALGSLSSVLGLGTLPCCTHAALAYLAEEQQTKASEPGTQHCLCSQREPQQETWRDDARSSGTLSSPPVAAGIMGSVHPLGAWAQLLTRAQKFEISHVRPGPVQCNNEMPRVNSLLEKYQGQNSFVSQRFETSNTRSGPLQCRSERPRPKKCKDQNTFLHDSFHNMAATCLLPNRVCRNGQNNCHQSANPIGKTYCKLIRDTDGDCRYSTIPQYDFYTVACDRPQPDDVPYPLVPVHLD